MITLAHVCRVWREIFLSRTYLWTDFYCEDTDKTRMTLDCPGSSPMNTGLERYRGPPLQVIPHAIAQLKYVSRVSGKYPGGYCTTVTSRTSSRILEH